MFASSLSSASPCDRVLEPLVAMWARTDALARAKARLAPDSACAVQIDTCSRVSRRRSRQRVIDAKPDREPCDRNGARNGRHHELVEAAVQHDQAAACCPSARSRSRGKAKRSPVVELPDVGERPVETDESTARCVDPLRDSRGPRRWCVARVAPLRNAVGGRSFAPCTRPGVLLRETVEYPRPAQRSADRLCAPRHAARRRSADSRRPAPG